MRKFFVLVFFLAACGSEQSTPTDGSSPLVCQQRVGTYLVDWDEQGGDCGPIDDETITSNGSVFISQSCVGDVFNSANMCQVNLDICCDIGDGYVLCQNGQANWSPDASTGEATLTLTLYDVVFEYEVCSSLYEVDFNRL